jgi:hypothetical protein
MATVNYFIHLSNLIPYQESCVQLIVPEKNSYSNIIYFFQPVPWKKKCERLVVDRTMLYMRDFEEPARVMVLESFEQIFFCMNAQILGLCKS